MARARLHLICGNCGCNDEWEWEHITEKKLDSEIIQEQDVFLLCLNCLTLHCINDNAEHESKVK